MGLAGVDGFAHGVRASAFARVTGAGQPVCLGVLECSSMSTGRMPALSAREVEAGDAAILVRDSQVGKLHRDSRRKIAERGDDQASDDSVIALGPRQSLQ